MTGGFVIEVDDPRREYVHGLLEQHRAFASSVMPPKGVHVLEPDDGLDPTITFFSLRVDGELLGIGALKQLDSGRSACLTPS
jgi:putative acetyltransferase